MSVFHRSAFFALAASAATTAMAASFDCGTISITLAPEWVVQTKGDITQATTADKEQILLECKRKDVVAVESLLLMGFLNPAPGTPNLKVIRRPSNRFFDTNFSLSESAHQIGDQAFALFLLRREEEGIWLVWQGRPAEASKSIARISESLESAAQTVR